MRVQPRRASVVVMQVGTNVPENMPPSGQSTKFNMVIIQYSPIALPFAPPPPKYLISAENVISSWSLTLKPIPMIAVISSTCGINLERQMLDTSCTAMAVLVGLQTTPLNLSHSLFPTSPSVLQSSITDSSHTNCVDYRTLACHADSRTVPYSWRS
jgi:hypothetical protein